MKCCAIPTYLPTHISPRCGSCCGCSVGRRAIPTMGLPRYLRREMCRPTKGIQRIPSMEDVRLPICLCRQISECIMGRCRLARYCQTQWPTVAVQSIQRAVQTIDTAYTSISFLYFCKKLCCPCVFFMFIFSAHAKSSRMPFRRHTD